MHMFFHESGEGGEGGEEGGMQSATKFYGTVQRLLYMLQKVNNINDSLWTDAEAFQTMPQLTCGT